MIYWNPGSETRQGIPSAWHFLTEASPFLVGCPHPQAVLETILPAARGRGTHHNLLWPGFFSKSKRLSIMIVTNHTFHLRVHGFCGKDISETMSTERFLHALTGKSLQGAKQPVFSPSTFPTWPHNVENQNNLCNIMVYKFRNQYNVLKLIIPQCCKPSPDHRPWSQPFAPQKPLSWHATRARAACSSLRVSCLVAAQEAKIKSVCLEKRNYWKTASLGHQQFWHNKLWPKEDSCVGDHEGQMEIMQELVHGGSYGILIRIITQNFQGHWLLAPAQTGMSQNEWP